MSFQPGHVPANKDAITTTRPFSKLEDIRAIKDSLQDDLRGFAMFTFAINTGFRASDIVALRRDELERENGQIVITVREKKTSKIRRVMLNVPTTEALDRWLDASDGEYVFEGQRGKMTVAYFGRLVKTWAENAGVSTKNVATHSLRKTFVRVNLEVHKVSLTTMQFMLNHADPRQTLVYAAITPDDAAAAYANVI